jgi:hypothetical protein
VCYGGVRHATLRRGVLRVTVAGYKTTGIPTDPDLIEVTDRTHPLFGRRFPVVRLCRSPHGEGFVEVLYRERLRLRIPLSSTDRATVSAAHSRTKLTLDVIQQLIALVKECPPCRKHPTASSPDSPKP